MGVGDVPRTVLPGAAVGDTQPSRDNDVSEANSVSREKIDRILAARQKEGHPEMSGRGHLHSRVLSDDNFIQVFIGDRGCEALIDTGATSSVVGRKFFYTLRESDYISVFPTHHQCTFAGGSTVAADCQLHMKIRIDGKDIEQTFLVLPHLSPEMILGNDFLRKYGIRIDFNRAQPVIHGPPDIWLTQTVSMPPHSEVWTTGEMGSDMGLDGWEGLINASAQMKRQKVLVAKGLIRVNDDRVYIRLLNTNPHSKTLKKGIKVGFLSDLELTPQINMCRSVETHLGIWAPNDIK